MGSSNVIIMLKKEGIVFMLTEEMLQEQHEQDLQRLCGFRLFDDDFMTRCFDGDTARCPRSGI